MKVVSWSMKVVSWSMKVVSWSMKVVSWSMKAVSWMAPVDSPMTAGRARWPADGPVGQVVAAGAHRS
jgi:hypothetical protein